MLATLKAGGFYVVIDPRYPAERNAKVLKNSQAEWVITDDAHRSAPGTLFPENRILMWHDEAAAGSPATLSVPARSSRRAAIVYTSGSTGQPKGVLHSHAFILNWTHLFVSDIHIAPSDRVSLLYSASVAGAIRDIFGALLTGATLLPFTARENSFNEMATYLVEERVSIYHSVASLFRQLVMSQSIAGGFPDVRALVFGGERVLAQDLSMARDQFQADAMVYTSIGSTETGTFARLFLRADAEPEYAVMPLGYAPSGCRIILMDESRTAVFDGEPGEIVVESSYLAEGYWHNPQETARVFSAVPLKPSLRRYHTGDMGIRDTDGMLHHRGRADRQFKVHGNRIEPAEIEAVLLAAPQIDNAFVKPVACGDDLQIVAYVESTGASEESLRAHCTRLLPLHMVPAEFHSYEQFPRLPNGKVDLQQMSRTVRPRAPASGSAVKVGEALSLRELWQSFLPGCEVTGKTDFFAAGGDSLLAMRIMNRVGELSGVKAPMTLLFQHPVLEAFETALQSLRPEHKNMRSMDDERYIKAGGSAASVASDYAQTNVQLYEQLFGQGYTPVQLKQLAAAYDLALGLFSTLLRPEGKPFVNHLVGTASILAQHGTAFPVVVGGLLHAAYSYGEFGSFRCGVTPRKRNRRVRLSARKPRRLSTAIHNFNGMRVLSIRWASNCQSCRKMSESLSLCGLQMNWKKARMQDCFIVQRKRVC